MLCILNRVNGDMRYADDANSNENRHDLTRFEGPRSKGLSSHIWRTLSLAGIGVVNSAAACIINVSHCQKHCYVCV